MKSIFNLSLVSIFLLAALGSCKKDENKVFLEGGFAPALKASVTGTIPLSFANQNETAVAFTWTNPNYKFTTGTSSQDVNYLLEIDTTGANFTNPNKKTLSVSKDLGISFTNAAFNDFLLNQLVLKPAMSHNLEVRVKSGLGTNSLAPITSNVLKFTATPYAIPPKVAPPSTGHLYLVGSATKGGWNNPVPVPTQEFTKISETLYEITAPLIGGQEYLILPLNGDWTHKYSVADKKVPGLSSGGDFKMDAADNFPGPAADGTYKISVDFQRGKFTVTP